MPILSMNIYIYMFGTEEEGILGSLDRVAGIGVKVVV